MWKLRLSGLALALIVCANAAAAGAAKPAKAIENSYRGVLERLAGGDVEAALEGLADLERNALGEAPSHRLIEGLWTAKLRVIRGLIQAESIDVLVPIIVFHHEAAAYYRDQREPALALHTRRMVDELAEFYAGRAEDSKADVFAGWVLASLGGYVQESRSFTTSRLLFERALDRDPANEFALLAVGVSLEMHGRYWEALDYYNRLLALRADNAEARLRAALCRLRGSIPDEVLYKAVPQLKRVATDENAPRWVRSVAFQEIAAEHMKAERRSEAEGWLRRGLEVVPGDQNQRIQLASLLERRGRRREALEVLRAIEPAPDTGDSPRRRYDRLPTDGLEDGRATMRRMMDSRLPLISAGLATAEGSAGASEEERIGG